MFYLYSEKDYKPAHLSQACLFLTDKNIAQYIPAVMKKLEAYHKNCTAQGYSSDTCCVYAVTNVFLDHFVNNHFVNFFQESFDAVTYFWESLK